MKIIQNMQNIQKLIKIDIKNINKIIIVLGILFFLGLFLLHYANIDNFYIKEGYNQCSPEDRGAALPLFKNVSKIKTFNNRINSNILKLEDSIVKNERVIKRTSKKSESDADKNLKSAGINKKDIK